MHPTTTPEAYVTMPAEAIRPNGDLRVPHHRGEKYVKDYNKGWRASANPSDDSVFATATGSMAYEDGYLDYAAGRDDQKWHLAWCTAHHNNEGGCGRS